MGDVTNISYVTNVSYVREERTDGRDVEEARVLPSEGQGKIILLRNDNFRKFAISLICSPSCLNNSHQLW